MSNKTTSKKITKRSYKYWGLAANFLSTITPIIYITFMYDIFRKSNMQVTAWFWIVCIFILSFTKKFIVDFVMNFNETYNKTTKRITLISTLTIISLILIASTYFLKDLVLLLLAIALGLLLGLYPYHKYHTKKEYYDRLKQVQTKVNDEEDIKSGRIIIK